MFNNLLELIKSMPDEKVCREYLAKHRWNGRTVCPYCGCSKCYNIEKGKRYKCSNKECFKRFTVTVGTIFEASNIPLNIWFPAIYLITAHKKGISSYQVAKDMGVTQKTGWFMLHRIREMVRTKEIIRLGAANPVEIDESFIGGKYANMHKSKRIKMLANGSAFTNKTAVLAMIERDGNLVTKVLPQRGGYELATHVATHIQKGATIITDDTNMYDRVKSSYKHHSVNHTAFEYVKDGNIHTNTIEGVFSLFDRMVDGIYHQITAKHMQRYFDEFTFRHNSREMKDADRFVMSLSSMECRLKYKNLIATPVVTYVEKILPKDSGKGIFQIKDSEIVGHYKSIYAASKATEINKGSIRQVCTGKNKTAGGFEWCFA